MENILNLVPITVEFLEDTKEYYAHTDAVHGAHAVGETSQEAVEVLMQLLPDLIEIQKNFSYTINFLPSSDRVSFILPFNLKKNVTVS